MNMELLNNIPIADSKSNKTSNGVLAVIAGSNMIAGSAVFNLLAASAIGTGYIYGVVTEDIFPICATHAPWVVYKTNYEQLKEKTILIGSGCDNRKDFDEILKNVLNSDRKVVMDAYALRRYKDLNLSSNSKTVMTPHLGEFAYMTGLSVSEIKENKEELAKKYAKDNNCILVLKDYETLITDGEQTYINTSGNSALAKAGSGDVLAGLISGLIARGVNEFEACKTGTYLMGLSAEIAGTYSAISSITPLDIIEEIKNILFEIKR